MSASFIAVSFTSPTMNLSGRLKVVLFFTLILMVSPLAQTATDDAYGTNDLLLFVQNPAGNTGTDKVVYFSLGSTYNVFREAATPTSGNFSSTISLGNIGGNLTLTFGADWINLASSIYFGAAGQNGNTSALSTTITNGDLARTV